MKKKKSAIFHKIKSTKTLMLILNTSIEDNFDKINLF